MDETTVMGLDESTGSTALSTIETIPTRATLLLDNQPVSLTAYTILGNNYVKLREAGDSLGFDVGWEDSTKTIRVVTK